MKNWIEKVNLVELAVVLVTGAALIGAVFLRQENLASALGGGLVGYLGAVVPQRGGSNED